MSETKVQRHKRLCEGLTALYERKNKDYADSFAKARKEIPNYTLGKIFDKFERYKNLSRTADRQVLDETIVDTLLDMANYCLMEVIEREIDNEHIQESPRD